MNKKVLLCIFPALAGLVVLGVFARSVHAGDSRRVQSGLLLVIEGTSTSTLISTVTPSFMDTETVTPRVLPAVGGNAGLVCGAIVLVLIIIGGVMFSSRKKIKH